MDIEELSKQQLVLLAALVSFITSIATGIVTVSMLEEAPVSVTRTVNRVVERTVERVVPAEQQASPKTITKEKTVVVGADKQITDAINTARTGVVRIYRAEAESGTTTPAADDFVGIGFVATEDGIVMTDDAVVKQSGTYQATLAGGHVYMLTPVDAGAASGVGILQIDTDDQTFTPVQFADAQSLQLGQAVIAMGGQDRDSVAVGIISEVHTEKVQASATSSQEVAEIPTIIQTNIDASELISGVPLIDTSGKVAGVAISIQDGLHFVTSNRIRARLENTLETATATSTAEGV